VDGLTVDFDAVRPRARALLRRLSMSAGHDVHREVIVESLWPGVEAAASTHRLQVAVSAVRGALERAGLPGTAVLHRAGEAYRLELPAGSYVDLHALEAALNEARTSPPSDLTGRAALLAAAIDLYTGELLPEDGPAEWVVDERDRLRRRVAAAAADLARTARRLGDADLALGAARRSLELDRYQDRTWDLVAALHEEVGDVAAAARARDEHDVVLRELRAPSGLEPARLPSPRANRAGLRRHGGRARA